MGGVASWSVLTNVVRVYSNLGIIDSNPPIGQVVRVELIPIKRPPSHIVIEHGQLIVDGVVAGSFSIEKDLTNVYTTWRSAEEVRVSQRALIERQKATLRGMLKQLGWKKGEVEARIKYALEKCDGNYDLNNLARLAMKNEEYQN